MNAGTEQTGTGGLLTVSQVSRLTGVSAEMVRYMLREGRLPGQVLGRMWLVPREALASIPPTRVGKTSHTLRRLIDALATSGVLESATAKSLRDELSTVTLKRADIDKNAKKGGSNHERA